MTFTPGSEDEQARIITRLVDGSLSDAERRDVEAWAEMNPEVERQVAGQRRVALELRTGGPATPDRLLDAVEARVAASGGSRKPSPANRPGRSGHRWRPAVAVALLSAAVLAVGVSIGVSSGGGGPSITRAASLAYAPPTQPAPPARTATLLDVSYGGVTYPNYAARFGAVATGARVDRIGGRPALTVFYRLRDGTRLSYTVFSGKPVPLPGVPSQVAAVDGVPLRVYHTRSGLTIVTLVRHGRTCVLAAPTTHGVVLALAEAPLEQAA